MRDCAKNNLIAALVVLAAVLIVARPASAAPIAFGSLSSDSGGVTTSFDFSVLAFDAQVSYTILLPEVVSSPLYLSMDAVGVNGAVTSDGTFVYTPYSPGKFEFREVVVPDPKMLLPILTGTFTDMFLVVPIGGGSMELRASVTYSNILFANTGLQNPGSMVIQLGNFLVTDPATGERTAPILHGQLAAGVAVPEPGTLALIITGGSTLWLDRRRRRRRG
jgi:hypothetical protein